MNQLDTIEEKLLAKHSCDMVFSINSDRTSLSSESRTPESHVHSDLDSSYEDDHNNFWM
jgi:hypothetical protein